MITAINSIPRPPNAPSVTFFGATFLHNYTPNQNSYAQTLVKKLQKTADYTTIIVSYLINKDVHIYI